MVHTMQRLHCSPPILAAIKMIRIYMLFFDENVWHVFLIHRMKIEISYYNNFSTTTTTKYIWKKKEKKMIFFWYKPFESSLKSNFSSLFLISIHQMYHVVCVWTSMWTIGESFFEKKRSFKSSVILYNVKIIHIIENDLWTIYNIILYMSHTQEPLVSKWSSLAN